LKLQRSILAMSQSEPSRFLKLLQEKRGTYGGAVVRLALLRENILTKVCFGRLDFTDGQEKNLIDIELDYDNFKLSRTSLSVDEAKNLVEGLCQDQARLVVKNVDISLKGRLSPPSIKYVASLHTWGMICPEWPSTTYYFQVEGTFQTTAPQHPLVKLNQPSYPDGNRAISEFCDLAPNMGYVQGQVIFVLPDFRARFGQLKVLDRKLLIDVHPKTENSENLRVKFYVESGGRTSRSQDLVIKNGRVEFPFDGELSVAMAHLLLTTTGEEIDNRIFVPYQTREGIEVESSELRIKELARAGEGLLVEYKSKLPPDLHRFLDSVVAFANTSGGAILVGVSDNCEIIGVDEPGKVKKTITNWISDKCDPRPPFNLMQLEVDGKIVIVVDVPIGPLRPYQDVDLGFFMRTGASNRQAKRSEVEQLFRHQQVARYA